MVSQRVKFFSSILLLVAVVMAGFWLTSRSGLALPRDIRDEVKFAVAYPAKGEIDNNTFRYLSEVNTLVFEVRQGAHKVSLSQQPSPEAFDLEKAVSAAGKLASPQGKSYDSIETKFGNATITNFYSDKDLSKIGQGAILNANGTLVTAQLTDGQAWGEADWKAFLNSLKVSK